MNLHKFLQYKHIYMYVYVYIPPSSVVNVVLVVLTVTSLPWEDTATSEVTETT